VGVCEVKKGSAASNDEDCLQWRERVRGVGELYSGTPSGGAGANARQTGGLRPPANIFQPFGLKQSG
jgi:hypothetical protein